MPTSDSRRDHCPLRLPAAFRVSAIAAAAPLLLSGSSLAQDAGPLIDVLVRKGVLSTQEAAELRSDLKNNGTADPNPAAKVHLSDSVSELKLYGDLRLRYQYDNRDTQVDPPGVGVNHPLDQRNPSGNQRSRWRFRLRLNADFKLAEHFFAGIQLETGSASDSANQTFENGFSDYAIYINKAYLGWSPNEWFTITGGKVPNPFYSTELVWDPDIAPTGITQEIKLHKLWVSGQSRAEIAPDGKTATPTLTESPFALTLVAGQFVFDDNLEGGGSDLSGASRDNDDTTDPYLFHTQLIGSYKFHRDLKLTVAPGWMVYSAGAARGLDNNNEFEDSDLVSGATRNLNLLLLPGDLSFKIAGIKTKVYWDFAFNLEGRKRVEDIYRLTTLAHLGDDGRFDPDDRIKNHSPRDDYAFLIGLILGENKKRSDWSFLINYRRIGLGSLDPNLSDNDFADGELNTQGFKFSLAYKITDFAVFGVTYQHAWQLRDILGGEATEGNAIGDANAVDQVQVDLNMKF